jgi:hypothetical protein
MHEQSHDEPVMHRRRITMADGHRYLIFYTFDEPEPQSAGDDSAKEEPKQEADRERHV